MDFNVNEIMDVLFFWIKFNQLFFNKYLMGANVVRNEWKMNE
jgi:hypothetical protein